MAEMAYIGRNEKGEWGLALGSTSQGSLIDLVGVNFFPLYRVVGPMVFFLSLLLLVWGGLQLIVTVFLRVAIIVRYKGCRICTVKIGPICSSMYRPYFSKLKSVCTVKNLYCRETTKVC
jgi:hypothetical protein